MKSLKIDQTGDLVVKNGDFFVVEDEDELSQTIKTLLQTNLNEWFLNPEEGLDYSVVFTKKLDEEAIVFAIRECLSQLDEIDRAEDFSFNFNSMERHLEVTFIAYTVTDVEVLVEVVI